jgi:transposase
MLNIRIGISRETVKALEATLRAAYRAGDSGLVKKVTGLLKLSTGICGERISQELDCSVSSLYRWLKALVYEGVGGLKVNWRGGRRSKLNQTQKARLSALVKGGPQAAGFDSACWNGAMLQQLIEREFGVLYNVQYVAQLLGSLGFSFQKARFVSDHLDEAARQLWLEQTWPTLLAQARAVGGLVLFGDEASFAQWGSLGYTWAPVGEQPLIKTTGKRKAYKVFGLIEFFSGQLFFEGIQGKLNATAYIHFLTTVLAQTHQPLFIVQDGAPYHRAAAVKSFITDHANRLTVVHLPSYSPDFNPIEYLWRSTKRRATHNHYFPLFTDLLQAVDNALSTLKAQPDYVRSLFTLYLQQLPQPLIPISQVPV